MQGLCLDVGERPHVAFTGAGVVGIVAAEAGVMGCSTPMVQRYLSTPQISREVNHKLLVKFRSIRTPRHG